MLQEHQITCHLSVLSKSQPQLPKQMYGLLRAHYWNYLQAKIVGNRWKILSPNQTKKKTRPLQSVFV